MIIIFGTGAVICFIVLVVAIFARFIESEPVKVSKATYPLSLLSEPPVLPEVSHPTMLPASPAEVGDESHGREKSF